MSQNQEIIESKLCAYIDGELDANDRAEIEKHLQANPQHRRLLEELRRTSALIHGLPRESAPAELAETFYGQLERSVLLQGIGASPTDGSMRVSRNPQIFAAAAIVLLTVGLAVVIYFALPSRNPHPMWASMAAHPTTQPAGPGALNVEARSRQNNASKQIDGLSASSVERQERQEPTLRNNETLGGSANARRGESEAAALRQLARKAAAGANDPLRARREAALADKSIVSGGALVMLVQSSDLNRTHRQLQDYFAANQILWEPADAPVAGSQKPAPGVNRLPAPQDLTAAERSPRKGADGLGGEVNAALPQYSPTTAPTTRPSDRFAGGLVLQLEHAAPTTNPSRDEGADLATSSKPGASLKRDGVSPTEPNRPLVLAARMTRRQVEALTDVLQRNGAAEGARVQEVENLKAGELAAAAPYSSGSIEADAAGAQTQPAAPLAAAAAPLRDAVINAEQANAQKAGAATQPDDVSPFTVAPEDVDKSRSREAPSVATAPAGSNEGLAPSGDPAASQPVPAPESPQPPDAVPPNSEKAASEKDGGGVITGLAKGGERFAGSFTGRGAAEQAVDVVIMVRPDPFQEDSASSSPQVDGPATRPAVEPIPASTPRAPAASTSQPSDE